jgi:hypothetical protein
MSWLLGTDSGAKSTYRMRALKTHGAYCDYCGYGFAVQMLDVHHIDSNRENNDLDNLQVLCVWCHALETRKVKWHGWNGSLPE